MATTCLNTTVINTSGARRFFDFLPPYGVYLDANQVFAAPGGMEDWIRRRARPAQPDALRSSMNYALDNGWITVRNTPATIVYDATAGEARAIMSNAGKLRLESPCYDSTPAAAIVVGPA
jgi:hypothetical protein